MRNILTLSLLLASTPLWAAPIQVLSSFSILGDVTQQLGGERIQVQTLIGANQDAHTYQLQS
ncbi:MAG: zinc ABC transporter substrate-binding protein, partial [Vitreoscilla sp.]|nr:zinc ABC transporter substrate-binding protein [Vitreoscilla sp.]